MPPTRGDSNGSDESSAVSAGDSFYFGRAFNWLTFFKI